MALSVLYDKVQSHLSNLCSLGVTVNNCAPILMPLVSFCLPAKILRTWKRKERNAESSLKVMLESLLEFLTYEVEGDQKIAMALYDFGLTVSHSPRVEQNKGKTNSSDRFKTLCEGIKKVDKEKPEVSKEGTQVKMISSISMPCIVILQTLLVKIKYGNHEKIIRALLDSASQKFYIRKSRAKEIEYLPKRCEPIQHSLFGRYTAEVTQHDVYTITLSSLEGSYTYSFKAIDQHKICGNIAPISSGPWVEELKLHNIYLSDVNTDGAIDVVGSLFTGKVSNDADNCKGLSMLDTSVPTKDAKITDLRSLDTLGITEPSEKLSKSELEAATLQQFIDSVKINEEAMKRMNGTIKRLKNERYYEAYQLVLNDSINEEIIEEVTEELDNK
ncbi:hypothetical protein ILUMI_17491 [Ignelater luminosus]|uniref:Uncharacterized protein n=1 Tax=Ignelater luminosus TaxID=2038154 RepID=A0A8K0CJS6_IGNLU|nr:hypothetical protein ILUMI_17491 [Ignelater luminosus]